MSFSSASEPSVLGLFAQVKVKPKPKPKLVTARSRSLSQSAIIRRLCLARCGLRHSTDLDIEVGLALATISWANISDITEIDRKHRKPKTIELHLMPLAHIDLGEAF